MSSLLKRGFKIVIQTTVGILSLMLIASISFYTPVFSSVGLWVLNHLPIPQPDHQTSSFLTTSDSAINNTDNQPEPRHIALDLQLNHQPTAYVVLGGGLTESDVYNERQSSTGSAVHLPTHRSGNTENSSENNTASTDVKVAKPQVCGPPINNIVLNKYSLIRMQTVMWHQKHKPLPIVLTGVEAPWMHDWLINYGIDNVITENASMNTCENARFTAKRLQLSNVYLVTDAYHMTRARRQFALNGIHTSPIPADLPTQKGWLSPKNNAQHSRRTIYELAAYARDIFIPQKNCRRANEVSFDTLLRSRKPESLKTF